MNSLTPDRKEFKRELEEGKGAMVWFVVVFIVFMFFIFFWVHKCTYNPIQKEKEAKKTTKVVTLDGWTPIDKLDSVINELPLGSQIELVFDEKEDITRAMDNSGMLGEGIYQIEY